MMQIAQTNVVDPMANWNHNKNKTTTKTTMDQTERQQ